MSLSRSPDPVPPSFVLASPWLAMGVPAVAVLLLLRVELAGLDESLFHFFNGTCNVATDRGSGILHGHIDVEVSDFNCSCSVAHMGGNVVDTRS